MGMGLFVAVLAILMFSLGVWRFGENLSVLSQPLSPETLSSLFPEQQPTGPLLHSLHLAKVCLKLPASQLPDGPDPTPSATSHSSQVPLFSMSWTPWQVGTTISLSPGQLHFDTTCPLCAQCATLHPTDPEGLQSGFQQLPV